MIVLRKLAGPPNFIDLIDTPNSYEGSSGKVISVNNLEDGLSFIDVSTNFLDLTDTPTTFSGFEGYYLKVNSSGDGLEFSSNNNSSQCGNTHISEGVNSIDVVFNTAFINDQYVVVLSLENKVDQEPSVYPLLVKDKLSSGFTVDFSGDIDSNNYYLNWLATSSGIGSGSGSIPATQGIQELSEDLSPSLGGNLEIGNHLTVLDTNPNNATISGGYVRGYSGEASYMSIVDNSPSAGDGFGTPLYMMPNGGWGTCTAVSGTNKMPCTAISIDYGEGSNKKILWGGIIRKGEWGTMPLTPGQIIYVSTVPGGITNVEPTQEHWRQPIGIALSSDTIKFNPGFNPGL